MKSQVHRRSLDIFLENKKSILIALADNPDGDSIGSAVAMHDFLEQKGLKATIFMGTNIPDYLKYISGWELIVPELPSKYDGVIILDTQSPKLFEILEKIGTLKKMLASPTLIIDHHEPSEDRPENSINIIDQISSTGELIMSILQDQELEDLSERAKYGLFASIQSDTLGLTTNNVTVDTYKAATKLVQLGVSPNRADEIRREISKRDVSLVNYKGELLKRVQFKEDNQLAYLVLEEGEIYKYSPLYNPSMLVIEDLRNTKDVRVIIAFKAYNRKLTAKIRTSSDAPVAEDLARFFESGGHKHASGIKIHCQKSEQADLINQINQKAIELLKDYPIYKSNQKRVYSV